jgi:DNA (cytosine-5)-methyltransferase 1
MKPRLLDLFCCQGGASVGYARAGFDVVGVDIDPQPRYPFEFVQADALEYLAAHGHEFDAIHASPPCQAYTNAQKIQGNEHPDLVHPTRLLLYGLNYHRAVNLRVTRIPWVIENVVGAPLHEPVMLCGEMFGVETYRHRLFESNVELSRPVHPTHSAPTTKMGRRPVDGEYMHIVGNFSGVDRAREVMDMPWANRDGLREAIPPAYAAFIGAQLMAHVERNGEAA